MRAKKRIYFQIAVWALIAASTALADNTIAIARPKINTLEVRLTNTEKIYSVLFSLHASSDIVLGELERGTRVTESDWIVDSYKSDDSTINVLILNWELKSLPDDCGALVKIPFTFNYVSEESYTSISKVMITNRHADSLGIAVNNLNWNNSSVLFAVIDEDKAFQLGQNFPNPFNLTTRIIYRLNKEAWVKLSIYNIRGREVKLLINRQQGVGEYSIEWNSDRDNGGELASGMYVARLSVDNECISRKMILTK
jgi:hypothetical protein